LPTTEKIHAIRLNQGAFDYAKELIKQGQVVADGQAHGISTNLQPRKRTNSFVCTDSANMQNGTSESTTRTAKRPKHDINFPMAISKMSIVALYSL
jgi:hypothetical protein